MINIENGEPQFFKEYKRKHNPKNYEDGCNDYELKEQIRADLLYKQRRQCAYCESFIDKDKNNFHIEHIRPRDKYHELECEYTNLVLSCNHDDSCGSYKKGKDWLDIYIHPVLDNPEECFSYNEDGKIVPVDKNASETIGYLNLNSNKLVRTRRTIFLQLYNMDDIGNLRDYFPEFENLVKFFEHYYNSK